MTTAEFVAETVRRTTRLANGFDNCYASYALGILAGVALHDDCVFSDELLGAAAACQNFSDVQYVEERTHTERLRADKNRAGAN